LLADFAAGRLTLAPEILVSAHLETCPACQRRVSQFEEAEGQILESSQPEPMLETGLDTVLSRLDEQPVPSPSLAARGKLADIQLPAAVSRAGVGQRRWLAPGLWAAPLRGSPMEGWRTFVLRAPAKTIIPTHNHGGPELIVVLKGAFQTDRIYATGDFIECAAKDIHQLEVTPEGPCACLIATQGIVHWRGLARLITPLLGL
jgi:putative transcriptional regulator